MTWTAAVCRVGLAIILAGPLAGAQRHVVMVVWDGMRPDLISDQNTPTLMALARRGVFFAQHHSAFVTSTEVNGTALSTGLYPARSGIMANVEFRPAIDPFNPIEVESAPTVRRGDRISGGHYIKSPTVAEILQGQNPSLRTAVAGSKAVALLLDRRERASGAPSPLLVEGKTQPSAMLDSIVAHGGPFPAVGITKVDRDVWTTRALVERFWAEDLPAFSVLWLAEPDWAQHHTGPASPASMEAIAGCDARLAQLLKALADRKLLDQTDVFVVSDHGFSTIERNVDLAVDLSKAGLSTARAYTASPAAGAILVTGLGASSGLYVTGHDPAIIQRAVTFLQQQDYTGVIFTRTKLPGTFPLSLIKVDSPDAPDILVSLQWSSAASSTGLSGMELSEAGAGRKAGQGTHAGLSPTDLHNTLIAAGPDFRSGWRNDTPSGNVDVAPTILSVLHVASPVRMDGRVLGEALVGARAEAQAVRHWREESTCSVGDKNWRQWLDLSSTAGVIYFDQGAGHFGAAALTPSIP
jgi:arylsulfatase A-like enzyme